MATSPALMLRSYLSSERCRSADLVEITVWKATVGAVREYAMPPLLVFVQVPG